MSECAQDISRIRTLLAELGFTMDKAITLGSDNVAAQVWASEDKNVRKAKHVELRYFFVRRKVHDGTIQCIDIASDNNPADGFTKSLDKIKFAEFRDRIGVMNLADIKHQEEC